MTFHLGTKDIKFLVSRCFRQDMCGGASDRLQDMPYNLMIANQTQRVLLLRWEKPAPLETFLVPPEGGIDWTLPNEMYNMSQFQSSLRAPCLSLRALSQILSCSDAGHGHLSLEGERMGRSAAGGLVHAPVFDGAHVPAVRRADCGAPDVSGGRRVC